MNVLLDTCALIDLGNGDLPDQAADALRTAAEAFVSAVSPWEVAIKAASGKLHMPSPPAHWFDEVARRHGLREVPVDAAAACAAAALPLLHRDPFDRLIVALAQARGLVVLTSDKNIARYPGVTTRW